MRGESNKGQIEMLAYRLRSGAVELTNDAVAVASELGNRSVAERESTLALYRRRQVWRAIDTLKQEVSIGYMTKEEEVGGKPTTKKLRQLRDQLTRALDYIDGKTQPEPLPTETGAP